MTKTVGYEVEVPSYIQTAVEFNLTNGEKYVVMGFVSPHLSKHLSQEESIPIKKLILEKAIEYIVSDDVAWGDVWAPRTTTINEADLKLYEKVVSIVGISWGGATIISSDGGDLNDNAYKFYLGYFEITDGKGTGCLLDYKRRSPDENGRLYQRLYVSLSCSEVKWISMGFVRVPAKP